MTKYIKYRKSGFSAKLGTPPQTFKMNAYRFLYAHFKPRTKTETLGEVSLLNDEFVYSVTPIPLLTSLSC
jgi:hypothetical protein